MGQEILYCWNCNNRILGSEFEKGKAVQVGNRASCAACAPALLATLTPEQRQAFVSKGPKPPSSTTTPRAVPRANSSVSLRAQREKSGPPLAVAAGVGAGAVLLIALIVVLSSGGGSKPPPVAPPVKSPVAAEISPKEKAAREAVAKAKAAGDVESRVRAWQEAVFACEGTSKLDEAKGELRAALAARAEAAEREFAALDEQARGPLRQEEFGASIALLEAGKKRRDDGDWRLRIEKRIAQIRRTAEELLPPLMERAAELKRRDATAELKAIEDRVAKWGMPELAEALRESLGRILTGAAYRQDPGPDGLVVIEAENFVANTPMGGQSWVSTKTAATVGAAMTTAPLKGVSIQKDPAKLSPRMEYKVDFVKTGRHYLWWRAFAETESDNSIHAGIDGRETPTLFDLRFSPGSWVWQNRRHAQPTAPATFDIDQPGVRTFTIWMREDGAVVDRVVITTNPNWAPKGQGPPESPR